MISRTIQKEQGKKLLVSALYLMFPLISSYSLCKCKQSVIFFGKSQSFHHFVCPSAPAFVSPTVSEADFCRAWRGFIVFLSFSLRFLFVVVLIQKSEARLLSPFPRENLCCLHQAIGKLQDVLMNLYILGSIKPYLALDVSYLKSQTIHLLSSNMLKPFCFMN